MWLGVAGKAALWICLISAFITMGAYSLSLMRPAYRKPLLLGRLCYTVCALAMLATFGILGIIVYTKTVGGLYRFEYAFEHTDNALQGFYRLAATWSGQEGSFLLWGSWTSIIGFLVFWKAGKYEGRVMPFFVTILAFLAAILIFQSPFGLTPPSPAEFQAAHPELPHYFPNGRGLNPSLQNYWMTIHPPTIFFGFASLAVPFCYAIAALIWKDYKDWTPRVMPYALLTCLTLGVGLFMGGYWAYETQGWHGFWAWDPVENASFFPWLCITALIHGLVVQKDRGGMARTTTLLGMLGFWLFLLGTFLTRSGALAGNGPDGQMLSIHAFDNIQKSGLVLMIAMLVGYGVLPLALWLWRLRTIPTRKTVGETLISRDFAFFLAVLLMIVACGIVTFGTTWPLFLSWFHKAPSALKPVFYNRAMLPLSCIGALVMGVVPWLAYNKTNSDTFLKKMIVPWFAMLAFGFFMLFWVVAQQHALQLAADPEDPAWIGKQAAWINPAVQRIAVMGLASLGFLAALSNSMLAFKVFRSKKPLSAGGWVAHVGIGLMMVGIITSNTFERTKRIDLKEGGPAGEIFGYKFEFEKVTGHAPDEWPANPEYDRNNSVQVRVTPPDGERAADGSGARTFIVDPKWFAYNRDQVALETQVERIRWPNIHKYLGHDLYVGLAGDPALQFPVVTLAKDSPQTAGPYTLLYNESLVRQGRFFQATLYIKSGEGKVTSVSPGFELLPSPTDPEHTVQENHGISVPDLRDGYGVPGAAYLRSINPTTKEASFLLNLPEMKATWTVPLEVTFKPWINVVWVGIFTMGLGVLMAMIRRAGEARLVADGPLARPAARADSVTDDDNAPIANGANGHSNGNKTAVGTQTSKPGRAPRRPTRT